MVDSMICLKNASVTRSGEHLLRAIDWTLERGEHWAVCGANGSGKTTFLRLLRGEIAPDADGERSYDFGDGVQETVVGLRHRIGVVSPDLQDFYVLHGGRATGREIVLAGFFDTPLLYETPSVKQEVAAEDVFRTLNMRGLAAMTAESMSTGQLRKVLIARSLALKPDVLLLDECLEGLDSGARESVLALVEEAANMTTLVVAAHHAADVPEAVRRVLTLERGEIVRMGGRENLCGLDMEPDTANACLMPPAANKKHAEDVPYLFRIRNADVVMEGVHVLQHIDWEMLPGENWAVLGENGAGKTTLLRLLLSEVAPYAEQGSIQWFGGAPFDTVRPGIGLVSQEFQARFARELGWEISVLDTVLSGFRGCIGRLEDPEPGELEKARACLAMVGLEHMEERTLRSLSYGQQRRVFIARAVGFGPRLLILDEPLSGLDAHTRSEILPLLEKLAESGTPLVLVTHHRDQMIPALNRVLIMDGGRIVFSGPREQWEKEFPK
jgi:molybdate transport system ATP-binding protein